MNAVGIVEMATIRSSSDYELEAQIRRKDNTATSEFALIQLKLKSPNSFRTESNPIRIIDSPSYSDNLIKIEKQ